MIHFFTDTSRPVLWALFCRHRHYVWRYSMRSITISSICPVRYYKKFWCPVLYCSSYTLSPVSLAMLYNLMTDQFLIFIFAYIIFNTVIHGDTKQCAKRNYEH